MNQMLGFINIQQFSIKQFSKKVYILKKKCNFFILTIPNTSVLIFQS